MRDTAQILRVAERFKQAKIVALPVDFGPYFHSVLAKIKLDAKRITDNVNLMLKTCKADEDIDYGTRRMDMAPFDFDSIPSTLDDLLQSFDLALRLNNSRSGLERSLSLDTLDDDYRFAPLKSRSKVDLGAAIKHMKDYDVPSWFIRAYEETVELLQGIVQRVEKLRDRFQGSKKLEPEKIETLYHASVNARDLYAKGFQLTRPEGGMGLGGSVEDNAGKDAISFTHDLAYALQIARWFKEMAMVASGDIKASQILRWANKEGIAEKVFEYASGLVSQVGDLFTEGGRVRLDFSGGKVRVVRDQWGPAKKEIVTETEDPDELFKKKRALYDLYMCYIMQSPHRSNPMSMNTTATLERMDRDNVQPRDIGVITAEIDMSDPDIKYLPGEAEYRVPPRSIKKVVRFVGDP